MNIIQLDCRSDSVNQQLIYWSHFGDYESLNLALINGANVNVLDPKTADSPLMIACRNGNVDIIRLCLNFGAKNDPHPEYGQTALHAAVSEAQLAAAAVLLEVADSSGAAYVISNLSDTNGQTPLHVASSLGDAQLVELLLRHDSKLSSVDVHGQSSLHLCAGSGNRECLAMLLDHGGDDLIEIQDVNGNTPLHHASFNGHLDCVRLLLETAAEVTVRNNKGQTAYHLARLKNHDQIMLLLVEYNGDDRIRDMHNYNIFTTQPSKLLRSQSTPNADLIHVQRTLESSNYYHSDKNNNNNHHRHISDSDVYQMSALPRPHTVHSTTATPVSKGQRAPGFGSSFVVDASTISSNYDTKSEPNTPNTNSYVTPLHGADKHRSNSLSGYRILTRQVENDSLRRLEEYSSAVITPNKFGDDGVQVYTKHKIINRPSDTNDLTQKSANMTDNFAVQKSNEFVAHRSPTEFLRVLPHPASSSSSSSPTRRSAAESIGISTNQFRSPSPRHKSTVERSNVNEVEYADPLEVFVALDIKWSVYVTEDGHVYYLNELKGHSQWEDPRLHGFISYEESDIEQDSNAQCFTFSSSHFPPKSPSPKSVEKIRNFGHFVDFSESTSHNFQNEGGIVFPSRIDWNGELSMTDDEDDRSSEPIPPESNSKLNNWMNKSTEDSITVFRTSDVARIVTIEPNQTCSLFTDDVVPIVVKKSKHLSFNNKSLVSAFENKVRNLQSANSFSLAADLAKDKQVMSGCRDPVISVGETLETAAMNDSSLHILENSVSQRQEEYLDMIRAGGSLVTLREKMEQYGESHIFMLDVFAKADIIQLDCPSDAVDSKLSTVEANTPLKCNSHSESIDSLKSDPVLGKYARMAAMGVPPGNVAAKMKMDDIAVSTRARLLVVMGLEAETIPNDIQFIKTGSNSNAIGYKTERPSVSSLQTLHWNALPASKLKNSIWSFNANPSSEEDSQNSLATSLIAEAEMQELEKLFTAAPIVIAKGVTEVGVKLSDQLKVLERKRAQNIDIGLVAFKPFGSHVELLKAICSLNTLDSKLTVDHLENFRALLPTDAEMKRIHEISGSKHPAELFMQAALMFYPELPRRLSCFTTCLNFSNQCIALQTKSVKIVNCCNQVLSSGRLARLLKKMLAVGNVMNQGTSRGQAAGFTLDSLLKMIDTKGVDKRTSVLDYVVKSLYDRGEENVLEVIEDLHLVEEGARLSSVDTLKEFDALEKHLLFLRAEQNRNQDSIDTQSFSSPTVKQIISQFHIRLESYLQQFEVQWSHLKKWRAVLHSKMYKVLDYFAEEHDTFTVIGKTSASDDTMKIFTVLLKFRTALMFCKESTEWKLHRQQQNCAFDL